MPPPNAQVTLAAQLYTFTHPQRKKQRYPPAPGCSLCTILTTLQAEQTIQVPPSDEASFAREDQAPFSPALPSPAVVANPLLPSATRNAEAAAVGGRVLLVDDDELTAWVASPGEELAREGRHVVVALKRHVEDVYAFVRVSAVSNVHESYTLPCPLLHVIL